MDKFIFFFYRSLQGDFTFITLLNIFDTLQHFNLHDTFGNLPTQFEYVLINDKSMRRKG